MTGFNAKLLLLILLCVSIGAIQAIDHYFDESILIQPDTTEYELGHKALVQYSETVRSDSLVWVRGRDYQIDYRNGRLILLKSPESDYLKIDYLTIPEELLKPVYLYRYETLSDSLIISRKPRQRILSEDSNLLVSGSKTFALTFSNDESFDLKQSLFVNLSGELSKGIRISAQLSDSQSKLSPEGDSRELSSLDQVFIKVYNEKFDVSMGDVEWKSKKTRFIDYSSKFEGIRISTFGKLELTAGYSAGNGKQAQMTLVIIEGKQGPYYLNSAGYQSSYAVVAGSESIYQNGAILDRGLDYTIDYSNGTVMFKRLVVPSDQIVVYYQYTDENYRQSMIFGDADFKLGDRFQITHNVIYQNDNSSSPLLYGFTEADKDSLRLAGDSNAWGAGAIQTEAGTGTYIQNSTPEGILYYVYAPTDTLADYNVTFSYVGAGLGDYDEFSSGKFVYKGQGQGNWIARKRLVAPVRRVNANQVLEYHTDTLRLGLESIYGYDDKNSLSALDDNDNNSAIFTLYGTYEDPGLKLQPSLGLSYENRLAKMFLFSKYSDPASEADLSGIAIPDSLQQSQLNAQISLIPVTPWTSQLAFRQRNTRDGTDQSAIRLSNMVKAGGYRPELTLRNTISTQTTSDGIRSIWHYHSLRAVWKRGIFDLGLDGLFNGYYYDSDSTTGSADTRYLKISPWFGIITAKQSSTKLSYTQDKNEIRQDNWDTLNQTRIYNLHHVTGSLNHNIDLDFTHRQIVKRPESDETNTLDSYDLIKIRSSHNLLKQAISLVTNYQLNQTEFFPSIRELEYIGDGLGLYDSTGVYTADGDYDYVYITSDQGTQSTEINGQLNLYLKPGQIFKNSYLSRLQADTTVNATEQTSAIDSYLSYIFYPGTVYKPETTIYGKQDLVQNIWIDLVPNRANLMLNLELGRSMDKRYQDSSNSYHRTFSGKLDLMKIRGINYNVTASSGDERDSRYNSVINRNSIVCTGQKYISPKSAFELQLSYDLEKGKQANTDDSYQISVWGITPSYKNVFMQKYRVTAKLGVKYNARSGSEYLSFLPEKRDGLNAVWSFQAVYKLNSFSSATIEYSGNSYPQDSANHQLKLEFKAEL